MQEKETSFGLVRLRLPVREDVQKLLGLKDGDSTINFSFFEKEKISWDDEALYLFEKGMSETDCLWIVTEAASGEIIGTCGLHEIDFVMRSARIGVLLLNAHFHGRGFGSDTIKALLKYAFCELMLDKVYLNVLVTNIRAQALYRRLGFNSEGLLRGEYLLRGQRLDMYRMSWLKSDWEELEAQKGR